MTFIKGIAFMYTPEFHSSSTHTKREHPRIILEIHPMTGAHTLRRLVPCIQLHRYIGTCHRPLTTWWCTCKQVISYQLQDMDYACKEGKTMYMHIIMMEDMQCMDSSVEFSARGWLCTYYLGMFWGIEMMRDWEKGVTNWSYRGRYGKERNKISTFYFIVVLVQVLVSTRYLGMYRYIKPMECTLVPTSRPVPLSITIFPQ